MLVKGLLLNLFYFVYSTPSLNDTNVIVKRVDDKCFRYHDQDCRDFKLTEVPTDGIENHLTVANEFNMDKEFSQDFGGIWYMNGNGIADECISFVGTNKQGSAYVGRVYEGGFTFNSNDDGRSLYNSIRTYGLTYYTYKKNSQVYHVNPHIYIPEYLLGEEIIIPDMIANFDVVRTPDPNLWIRNSTILGKQFGDYQFVRIVYPNGTRTSRYQTDYLANINSNKKGVTLRKTQLIVSLK
ncbi:hypothetical protein HDV02_006754 [Globomyces sp. JEL0801]|nr:hypothetical protein HDV02_006754 [Globomyces sp. JEL0801]